MKFQTKLVSFKIQKKNNDLKEYYDNDLLKLFKKTA